MMQVLAGITVQLNAATDGLLIGTPTFLCQNPLKIGPTLTCRGKIASIFKIATLINGNKTW